MRSKIHMCQWQIVPLIASFLLDVINQWLNSNWFKADLASDYCLTTSNQKEGLRRQGPGLLDGIFWSFCCKVWKQSDAILGGKNTPVLEPFEKKDSSHVLLLGTVNGELKILQNCSKNRFWGKRMTTYRRWQQQQKQQQFIHLSNNLGLCYPQLAELF